MQLALGCDRVIVATTYRNPKAMRFAQKQNVALLNKDFLRRLQDNIDTSSRITAEQFAKIIAAYSDHKLDGDWLERLARAKSALVSLNDYPAFIKAMTEFKFFAKRADTRPQHKEQAIRSAFVTAGLACVALDSALEQILYEDIGGRYQAISRGVTYGDAGDAGVQNSIDTVLNVISAGMENGNVVARQARDALDGLFRSVRADVIAEYFSREHNASHLFKVAKELDDRAYSVDKKQIQALSTEARSILGVFADFVQIKRNVIIGDTSMGSDTISRSLDSTNSEVNQSDEAMQKNISDSQGQLL